MKSQKIRALALCAMFAALVFVMTYLSLPTPLVGNINLGDGAILLGAFLLGGIPGAIAGGIGATLCDIVNGYIVYAPATLLIKAGMALIAAALAALLIRLRVGKLFALLLASFAAEAFMVLGYFFYEAVCLSYGLAAAANIPFNAIQGGCGMVLAVLLYTVLEKSGMVRGK